SPRLEVPQRPTGACIQRKEVSFLVTAEHQPAAGGQDSCTRRTHQLEPPFRFAGRGINGHDRAFRCVLAWNFTYSAGLKPLPFNICLWHLVKHLATIGGAEVIEPGLRTVGSWLPVVPAAHPGARLTAIGSRPLVWYCDRLPVQADAGRPSHLGVRFRDQQLA